MSVELYYGKSKLQEFPEVVDQFSVKQINSLETSTLPLLQYWKNQQKVRGFLKNLDIDYSPDQPIQLCFEYPTPVKKGEGTESRTDLMIIGDGFKIAVEAKYKEYTHKVRNRYGEYEPIRKWYRKGKDADNRCSVLEGWFGCLKEFCNLPDDVINDPCKYLDKIGGIPYQFLHRVASACDGKPDRAYVVYQIFYDEEAEADKDDFVNELTAARETLDPKENLKIAIQTVQVRFTADDIPQDDRKKETKERALQRIKDNELYEIVKEDWILNR